jgi:hypothetical protein
MRTLGDLSLRFLPPALAGFVVAGLVAVSAGYGCSQGSGGTEYPTTDGQSASAAPSSGPSGTSPAASGSASAGPEDFSMCTDMNVESLADPPDGGVVMNNATTAGDAGASDRFQPIMDIVTQHRPRYACCFDLWGRNNPGKAAKIGFFIDLDPEGAYVGSGFKKDETEIDDARVEACMNDVTRRLTYPKSPGGHNTKYVHRFKFRTKK